MRLPALVVIAIAGVTAGQVPVSQTQPPRDVVRRAEPTGTARIRGRVVLADRGIPVRRATVILTVVLPPPSARGNADGGAASGQTPGPSSPGRAGQPPLLNPKRATTDGDGQFEFAGLPAGTYRVSASPGQYSSQYLSVSYGASKPSGMYWPEPGQSVELADGQSFDKVVIALPRGGVITGRVTDENDEPLARVQVYTMAFPPGTTRAQRTGGGSSTDDLGQFRLWGLSTGEYLVVADARFNSFVSPTAPPETEEERIGFVSTYYPGAADEGSAQRVRVKAGAETGGIDIRVAQARLFHISGTVIDSQGRPVANANGQLMRRGPVANGPSGFFAMSDPKGQFQMRNVPPGDYRLTFRPQQIGPVPSGGPREPVEVATVPLSIAGADVDNLTVVTSPGVTITGQVVFEQGPPQASAGAQMRVIAVALSMNDAAGIPSPEPAIVAADSTFTLKGLMGEYALRTAIPNQFTKSITVNGQDATDTPREFKASDRVSITVTSRVSTVEGTVTDTRDVDLAEAGVILFSEDKSSWRLNSIWTKRTGVDAKGHFRIAGLMPGRYYIAAVPRQRFALWGDADAAFFEQLAKEATIVTVGSDEQRTVDLRLLDSAGRH